MKSMILSLLLGLFCTQSFAAFQDVKAISCDGESINKEVITRVYINLEQGLFGIGENEIKGEETCKIVNFYTSVIMNMTTVNGEMDATIQPVINAAKRSSCESGSLPFDGPEWSSARLQKDKVTITNIMDCDELTLSL